MLIFVVSNAATLLTFAAAIILIITIDIHGCLLAVAVI